MQTIDLVKKIVEALEDKKAEDITVLDIGEVSSIADYFIIANGNNANQLTAMEDDVDEAIALAEKYIGPDYKILLMPQGSLTVPVLKK